MNNQINRRRASLSTFRFIVLFMFLLKFAKSFQKWRRDHHHKIVRLWKNKQARLENTSTKLKSSYCVTAVIYARQYIIKLCG
jgi:hypothetical protein